MNLANENSLDHQKQMPVFMVVSSNSAANAPTNEVPDRLQKPGKQPHLRIDSDQQLQELIRLTNDRGLHEEEMEFINKLWIQRNDELNRATQELRRPFGVRNGESYTTTMTIHRLLSDAEKEQPHELKDDMLSQTEESSSGKVLHRVLTNLQDQKAFLELVDTQQISIREMAILRRLLTEKEVALDRVKETLQEKFALSPDKKYEYNMDERILYETIPVEDIPNHKEEGAFLIREVKVEGDVDLFEETGILQAIENEFEYRMLTTNEIISLVESCKKELVDIGYSLADVRILNSEYGDGVLRLEVDK
ncbi:MAG: hypothetical protein GKR87_09980 [Kiritimatiellae bacterium]|nr:hypothetical protein [Kiritimatiellia bacterium]